MNKSQKNILSWKVISERILKMNLMIYGYRTTIVRVYGVNDSSLVNTKDKFLEDLNNKIGKVGKTREIIILGDPNNIVEKDNESQIVGSYGEDTRNDNRNRSITFSNRMI